MGIVQKIGAGCRIVTLAAICSSFALCGAKAEFIMTRASGVYQHASGTTKVILGARHSARGLFIMAGDPIPPQEFNLERTSPDNVRHLFIRFDEQSQPPSYSEVVINNRAYKISGNLTINLGARTTISVDNNNPYITVVTRGASPGEPPSIVGFSGLNEIVKATGALATILAANQLNAEVAKVILPYSVENNELLLNNKPVSTSVIGTFVRPESECLKPASVVLKAKDFEKIQGTKGEDERMQLLNKFMTDARKSSPLKDHLVLKADPESVILLDIRDKNIHEMHTVIPKASRQRVCVMSDILPK